MSIIIIIIIIIAVNLNHVLLKPRFNAMNEICQLEGGWRIKLLHSRNKRFVFAEIRDDSAQLLMLADF